MRLLKYKYNLDVQAIGEYTPEASHSVKDDKAQRARSALDKLLRDAGYEVTQLLTRSVYNICHNCSLAMPSEAKFCQRCGEPEKKGQEPREVCEEIIKCPKCKGEIEELRYIAVETGYYTENEGFAIKSTGGGFTPAGFHCPECDELLTNDINEANKLLKKGGDI